MKMRIGAGSDIGRARERNEDSYVVEEPLFAVADGMGGHRGGAVASSLALDTLRSTLRDEQTAPGALIEEIKQANQRVLERGQADRDLRGMGTTLTAVFTDQEKAHIAHIGDSRAYLLRDGSLKQLTEDHSLVQRMVMEGKLTPEEAERHPQRSILTRALGVDEDVEPDTMTLDPILPGDRLLLCTDGLISMLETEPIQEILESESDPQQAADLLIQEANAAGGEDNITVLVIDFANGAPARSSTRGTTTTRRSAETSRVSPQAAVALEEEPQAHERQREPIEEPRKRGATRAVIWTVLAIALLVGLFIGARAYLNNQWYVGEAGGRVAIYNGIPTKVLGIDLSHVEGSTNISAPAAERFRTWQNLRQGITAGSQEEAQSIVNQIRRDVAEASRPKSKGKKR